MLRAIHAVRAQGLAAEGAADGGSGGGGGKKRKEEIEMLRKRVQQLEYNEQRFLQVYTTIIALLFWAIQYLAPLLLSMVWPA